MDERMQEKNKIVDCQGVSKEYRKGIYGVEDLSFSIEEGEFVYLLGASGSGKSTLMKLLFRDMKATNGTISVCGYDVNKIKNSDLHKLRREIGVVYQDYKLLSNKTVYENVAYALEITGTSKEEIDPQVRQTLTLVELADKAGRYPSELSGGEQQRVAIARAIINKPKLILADEPTGNLDPKTAMGIFRLLYRINRGNTTVILATHNRRIVNQFRFRTLRMDQGKLVNDQAKCEQESLQYDYIKKEYVIV